MLLAQVAQKLFQCISKRDHEILRRRGKMTTPTRGGAARIRERARAFMEECLPWSMRTSPQELEGPVPRDVGGERFESREAGRTETPSIAVPNVVSATSPTVAPTDAPSTITPAPELKELWKYLPKGSVYLWAAMVDGAVATDAIAGWIVLMVRGRATIVWQSVG